MSQVKFKKSKSKSQGKKMYHFRMCQLFFRLIERYAEKRNLTHSAIIRNAIKYCYNTGIDLKNVDVPALLVELMKKLNVTVQNVELEVINCVKPDAHIKMYKALSFQIDAETNEILRKYISQKDLTGGLSRAEVIRRSILYYISRRESESEADSE